MLKSRVFEYSFEANYSSTLCSRLPSTAKSIFFMSSSSDDLISTMTARPFGTVNLRKKKFAKPFSTLRSNKIEPNLKSIELEKDKRQYTKFRKRSESLTELEKSLVFEHEPHCPLFKVKQNSIINNRSANEERKCLNFVTNRNETSFQKTLRIIGPLNAKDLVDKYFDG